MSRPIAILVAVLLCLILFVFGYMLVQIARPPAPSLAYSQAVYTPERATYQAGDTMVVTVTLTVQRPGIVDARRGWRVAPGGVRATLCDGTPAPLVLNEPPPYSPAAVGRVTPFRLSVTVPNLRPGRYELVSTSFNKLGAETTFTVPITITGEC